MYSIEEILQFAESFIGISYKWYRDGDSIFGIEDKFFAIQGLPPPTADEIRSTNKSIVCTGLINILRRFQSLTIPGIDGSMGEIGLQYPGTVGIWFEYLQQKDVLHEFRIDQKYPKGTLLLRNFHDVESDQGHVAILFTDNRDINSSRDELILHSYANIPYSDSNNEDVVGEVGLTVLAHSHFYQCDQNCGIHPDECTHVQLVEKFDGNVVLTGGVYYTHVCFPEDWLMRN